MTSTEPIATTPAPTHPARKWLIRALKFILTALVVYFAGREIARSWQDVVDYQWDLNWWLIGLSVLLHLIAFAGFSQVWCWLMLGLGYNIPLRHGFKLAYIANLGRYIPGRIWPIFGMVYLAKQMKIAEAAAIASWGLGLLFGMPPSFLAVSIATWIYPEMLSAELHSYIGPALNIGMLVFLGISAMLLVMPNRALWLANMTLRMIRRPAVEFNMKLRLAALVYFGYFVCWLIYGFGFWTLVHAVAPNSHIPIFAAIGAFILSYQIGYLAIFTPGGLGARELVMIAVLTPFLGPAAAGIAVAARLWNTLSDIVASAIALKIKI